MADRAWSSRPGIGTQGRRVQRCRVEGRAAPAGDEQFGVGESAVRDGGGEIVQDELRVDVGEGGQPGPYVRVEDLLRGLPRHGQHGARTSTGPEVGVGHLTLPAVRPDFQ